MIEVFNLNNLIILMAPPGAGKSELAEYIHRNHPNSIIINQNQFNKKDVKAAKVLYYNTINRLLDTVEYIILDSDNVLLRDRQHLFQNIDCNNTNIIGVWIEVSRKTADRRNQSKPLDKQVSAEDMDLLFKYKISPMPEEPFDDIIYIMRDADIGMSKSHPYLTSTLGALDRI